MNLGGKKGGDWMQINELKKIKEVRKKKKLTQQEVAEKSGYDRAYISRVENGVVNPTFNVLKDIAQAMGTTVKKMIN